MCMLAELLNIMLVVTASRAAGMATSVLQVQSTIHQFLVVGCQPISYLTLYDRVYSLGITSCICPMYFATILTMLKRA
jgi:hypothetical protein